MAATERILSCARITRSAPLIAVQVVHPGIPIQLMRVSQPSRNGNLSYVPVGTSALAGGELPLVSLVLEAALVLLAAATRGSVAEVAADDRAVDDGVQRLRVPRPIDQLLAGDEVDVGQGQNGVDKVEEALLAVGTVEEPRGVEEQGEGSLCLGVILQEVLGEDLLYGGSVFLVEASVGHGASASAHVLDGGHGDLPHAGVAVRGAGLDGAVVGHLVLKGVGPRGGGSGHGAVVVEAISVEHVEHGVSSNGQEWRAHALDVLGVHTGESDEHFGLADHFVGPLLLVEVGTVAVGDCVAGHFVAVGVEILHLGVVRPFVRDVKSGLDGTSVGVSPIAEKLLEEGSETKRDSDDSK